MAYKLIGTLQEVDRCSLLDAVSSMAWKQKGAAGLETNYQSIGNIPRNLLMVDSLTVLFGARRWLNCFAVKLAPGGELHPHTHVEHRKTKYLVVLQTNEKAISRNGEWEGVLEQGGVYEMESGLEHSASNHGDSDRIHLILEISNA